MSVEFPPPDKNIDIKGATNEQLLSFYSYLLETYYKKCRDAIKKSEKLIKNHGRMLIRKSGTEPKIRIMGESNNIKLLKRCINIVKRSII